MLYSTSCGEDKQKYSERPKERKAFKLHQVRLVGLSDSIDLSNNPVRIH